jgi:hypothetical protein
MSETWNRDSSSTFLCEIKDVIVSNAGDDSTGQATGGHLILRTPSIRVEVCEIDVLNRPMSTTELGIWSRSWLSQCYATWDHGQTPGEILVELVFNWMTCLPLIHKGAAIDAYCDLRGLILLVNDAQEDSHIRIGTISGRMHFKEGQRGHVSSEAVALGIGTSYEKSEGRPFIDDRTKLKTFKIV